MTLKKKPYKESHKKLFRQIMIVIEKRLQLIYTHYNHILYINRLIGYNYSVKKKERISGNLVGSGCQMQYCSEKYIFYRKCLQILRNYCLV